MSLKSFSRSRTAGEDILDLSLAVAAGMMKNGGETYRSEECVLNILRSWGAMDVQVVAIPTSIIATAEFEEGVYTRTRSIRKRDVDLKNIDILNTVSRKLCEKNITAEEAYRRVEEIEKEKPGVVKPTLFAALSAASFSVLFGSTVYDFLFGFISAIITNLSLLLFKKGVKYGFLTALAGSMITAAVARVMAYYIPLCNEAPVIIGGIMPMLPGLAVTNAVRDTIKGDLVSGSSRALEAVLQCIAIAAGVGIVLSVKRGGA